MDGVRPWGDERVEESIGKLLRAGVLVAAVVVMSGGVLYLARHGRESAAYHVFHGEPSDLRGVSGVLHDVWNGRARGIIQLGLLLASLAGA